MVVSLKRQRIPRRRRLSIPFCLFLVVSLFFLVVSMARRNPSAPLRETKEAGQSLVPSPLSLAWHWPSLFLAKSTERGRRDAILPLSILTHTVLADETLSLIAARYGLRLGTLISFNDLSDVASLREGDTLSIPREDGVLYRVQKSETLASISTATGIPLHTLITTNNLSSPLLKKKQCLFLPGATLDRPTWEAAVRDRFLYPSTGTILSPYGKVTNPQTGIASHSYGIKIVDARGTPVKAIGEGIVSSSGFHPFYGRYLTLTHARGFQSLYGHLAGVIPSLGSQVLPGERLGEMAPSPKSRHAYLSFVLFKDEEDVNPLDYLY